MLSHSLTHTLPSLHNTLKFTNYRAQSMLIYKKGDLLNNITSIAHCVSEDLAMKKGLALQIKKKYGGTSELKKQKAKEWGRFS